MLAAAGTNPVRLLSSAAIQVEGTLKVATANPTLKLDAGGATGVVLTLKNNGIHGKIETPSGRNLDIVAGGSLAVVAGNGDLSIDSSGDLLLSSAGTLFRVRRGAATEIFDTDLANKVTGFYDASNNHVIVLDAGATGGGPWCRSATTRRGGGDWS